MSHSDVTLLDTTQNRLQSLQDRPLRILQVIGGLNRGGYETWALNVARLIDRSRFQIDFLVDTTEDYAYNREIRSLGSEVIPCLNYRNLPVYWENMKDILRRHGPYDVVHSHVHYFSGVVVAMAARLKVPSRIVHMHPAVDIKPPSLGRSIYRKAMMTAISRFSTAVFACSDTSLHALLEESRPKTPHRLVVPNGVNLASYRRTIDKAGVRASLGLPKDKLLVTYVARLVPHKNHDQIFRIAKRLAELQDRSVHFVFAGSHGTELSRIQKTAEACPNVTLLLGMEDVSSLLLASDIFMFPSLEEGFGVVAIEAAAAGLPVLATDLPTIREALSPQNANLCFPPQDDEAAFAALQRLVNDDSFRLSLGEEGKRWVERFSMDNSVRILSNAYDEWCRPLSSGHKPDSK